MKLFQSLEQVRQLPQDRQRDFERYYHDQARYRLRPVLADLSLFLTIIGTIIYLFILAQESGGAGNLHILNYVYLASLSLLAICHRLRKLRNASPLIAYIMFFTMALFTYLNYIAVGGGIIPVFSLFFFISSLGFITLSFLHASVIVFLNLVFLTLATYILSSLNKNPASFSDLFSSLTPVLGNWFAIMCMLVAPVSGLFSRFIFRNIMALKFMLDDRNKLLSETLKTLKSTEGKLIQQQKHQALSLMAKGLLHEIMNPVNCSTQALNYAKSTNRDPETGEAIEDAIINQERIASIVSDLQDFSATGPEHTLERTNLLKLIKQAEKFCQNELREKELQISIPEELQLYCHPSALTQVFVNLLLNSAEAIRKKPFKTQAGIQISCEQNEKLLHIFLHDNGVGISEDDLQHLTDPFYTTQQTKDHHGLGLSICQTIMRHHHGQLSIKSRLGEWTTVTLSLRHP